MMRKGSNKENVSPSNKVKPMHASHDKRTHGKKVSCSSIPKGSSKVSNQYRCTQKELSNLKNEVKKMRKEVEIFKAYYLTRNPSQLKQSSEYVELPLSNSKTRLKDQISEEYLITSSQSLAMREQQDYYIKYYLQH